MNGKAKNDKEIIYIYSDKRGKKSVESPNRKMARLKTENKYTD